MAPPTPPPALPPLSHHDVLARAEPFGRAGLALDLEASDRMARRLEFTRFADAEGAPAERWRVEDTARGRVRLTRTLHDPAGHEAALVAQGADAARLLAQMAAVPAARLLHTATGGVISRDCTLGADGQAVLARARCLTAGIELQLVVPAVPRLAGELTLSPLPSHSRPALPEDLLAVLGWNWARLVPTRAGWTSRLRLRASGPTARTERADAAFARAAAHLVRTLAEPPAHYHARWHAARWGVFFRRGIPSLTALGLVALVLLSALLRWQPTPLQMILMYHLPTLVIALSFLLQELPRFELPPWPRVLRQPAWTQPPA